MKTEEIMSMMQRAWDTESEQIFDAYRMGIGSLLEELVTERDDLRTKLEQAEPVAYFMNTGTDADPLWEQLADEYKFDHESVPLFAAPVQPKADPVNAWKEALLDGLATYAIDAPVGTPPREILRRVIDMAVTIALDPQASDVALQPVRGPLTDEEIEMCIEAADTRWADSFVPVQWSRHFAKAIERRLGITKD